MTRGANMVASIATVLIAVVISAVLIPVCTMPGCEDTGAASCSNFASACDQCPAPVVMKHSHDDATSPVAFALAEPAIVAAVFDAAEPALLSPAPIAPRPTASPPPLDPLGVRLTV